MKSVKIIFIICVFLFSNSQLSSSGLACGTTSSVMSNSIPLTGTVRAYFVFVQFKNDIQLSSEWPLNSFPSWANNFVNDATGGPYSYPNISHYFDQMSNHTFQIIGDVYDNLVTTNLNENQYSSIGQVNREVLSRIDSEVNFSL